MIEPLFRDVSGQEAPALDPWDPVVFTADVLDTEIERLASGGGPANGRRESLMVHPRATEPGLGLTPGIRVTLSVLKPGERTEPIRHNSTQVSFCILGSGHSVIDGHRVDFGRYDVWNHPAYRTYWHENQTHALQARLTYSNAPVLEKLHVHVVEENPPEQPVVAPSSPDHEAGKERPANPFGTFPLGDDGAMLMPYETLISPPAVSSPVLHWPWDEVRDHLDRLDALGDDYRGRRLYLLYNPMTGRTNGTTPTFFATMTIRPPGIVDRPHRHTSAAINYFFAGHGWSQAAGRRYEWSAGDLMFTAPGWTVHHHASGDERVYELTIQDQPLNLAMESLLWQEDLAEPARLLGSEAGFATNRS